MSKPMHSAGRIVLVRDITASDRERMPDWFPDDIDRGRISLPRIAAAVVVVVAFWAAVAWWVWA